MVVETIIPARMPKHSRRWLLNLAVGSCNLILARSFAFVGSVSAATWAHLQGIGFLNLIESPVWLAWLLTIIFMDGAVYWQHRLLHRYDCLWRLHRFHHADDIIDVTTGVRFNPAEIGISLLYKAIMIIVLGAPPEAALAFELLLASASYWEHANLALPSNFELQMRKIFVTPKMHLVHHSANSEDINRNFGFFLSVWDRVWGSYKFKASTERIGLP